MFIILTNANQVNKERIIVNLDHVKFIADRIGSPETSITFLDGTTVVVEDDAEVIYKRIEYAVNANKR